MEDKERKIKDLLAKCGGLTSNSTKAYCFEWGVIICKSEAPPVYEFIIGEREIVFEVGTLLEPDSDLWIVAHSLLSLGVQSPAPDEKDEIKALKDGILNFFPTAEAALASIKVYGLNGVEGPLADMEGPILGELELASRGRGAFLEMKDLQVKAKIEEALRCNEAGMKSATSLHLGEALRLLKERTREGWDLAKSTLADHGITYNDERRDGGGC